MTKNIKMTKKKDTKKKDTKKKDTKKKDTKKFRIETIMTLVHSCFRQYYLFYVVIECFSFVLFSSIKQIKNFSSGCLFFLWLFIFPLVVYFSSGCLFFLWLFILFHPSIDKFPP